MGGVEGGGWRAVRAIPPLFPSGGWAWTSGDIPWDKASAHDIYTKFETGKICVLAAEDEREGERRAQMNSCEKLE